MALTRLGLNQSINLATNVTGTLATGNGGTGATSFAPGKIGQVLQSETNSQTTVSSTTYASISLSQAITPSATSGTFYDGYHKSTNSDFIDGGRFPFMYIDSPSSTSAITYSVRLAAWNNLSITANNDGNYSQIQCWEILA